MKVRASLVQTAFAVSGACTLHAAEYTLPATPSTVVWGYYSAQAKPALKVHSGDTVRMQTASSCPPPARLEEAGARPPDIPHTLADIPPPGQAKGPAGHHLPGH